MNRVNPLYIALLLVFILVISIFKLSAAKSELDEVKLTYKETSALANELVSLKRAYKDSKKLKSIFRSLKVETKFKKHSLKVSSSSLDKRTLNNMMSKVLNGSFNITSLTIKKLSPQKVSFDMEIKW